MDETADISWVYASFGPIVLRRRRYHLEMIFESNYPMTDRCVGFKIKPRADWPNRIWKHIAEQDTMFRMDAWSRHGGVVWYHWIFPHVTALEDGTLIASRGVPVEMEPCGSFDLGCWYRTEHGPPQ
jgi:hypothetical protein